MFILGMIHSLYDEATLCFYCLYVSMVTYVQCLHSGFISMFNTPICDVFNMEHRKVYQDMTQPLSHYFINSSHNTWVLYLCVYYQVGLLNVYSCVCVCVCVCVSVCLSVCMCMWHTHTHTHMHTLCVHASLCLCVCAAACVCVCVCVSVLPPRKLTQIS